MFGNLLGWIISAVIALGVTALIVTMGRQPGISRATGTLPQGLRTAAVSPDPNTIPGLPAGTADCDAGDLYRQAAAYYKKNERNFRAFDTGKNKAEKAAAAAKLGDGLDLIVKARDCSRMNLFARKPEEVVNYDNSKPVLPELQPLARITAHVGSMTYEKDPRRGRELLEASFVLGRNLYNERVVFEEYRIGTEAMGNAAGQLAAFLDKNKDAEQIAQLKQLDAAITDYQKKEMLPLWKAISQLPETDKGLPYPGDIFAFAQESKEPMWQTEALLKLGRMKWMKGVKYGDQVGAERTLRNMADRQGLPPNVKAAAAAGRDLKQDDYWKIGGGT